MNLRKIVQSVGGLRPNPTAVPFAVPARLVTYTSIPTFKGASGLQPRVPGLIMMGPPTTVIRHRRIRPGRYELQLFTHLPTGLRPGLSIGVVVTVRVSKQVLAIVTELSGGVSVLTDRTGKAYSFADLKQLSRPGSEREVFIWVEPLPDSFETPFTSFKSC